MLEAAMRNTPPAGFEKPISIPLGGKKAKKTGRTALQEVINSRRSTFIDIGNPSSRDQIAAPFYPTSVPALKAGGIWLTDAGISSIAGGKAWASQGTQTNSFLATSALSYDVPTLTVASNGVPVWNITRETFGGSLIMLISGSALRFSARGSYAGWFKANEIDTNQHYMIEAFPDGVNQRFTAYKSEHASAYLISNMSDDGTGMAGDGSHRFKFNGTPVFVDMTQWNFFRWTFDFSLTNYSLNGANLSNRLKVYVNEVLDVGSGYSAPPPPFSSPPDGPIRGTGLYSGEQRLCVGGSYNSANWNGQIGHFYVANEENDTISLETWRKIMNYQRPT